MIKAIILDVDGVIIGEKIGYNSPHPHSDVLNALKKVRNEGVAICLCTAKPYYALSEIINGADLRNPHITDAGGVIINPIDEIIVQKHQMEQGLVKEILQVSLDNNIYAEFYTVKDYFIQKSQQSDITNEHAHVLQRQPIMISNFVSESSNYEIVKLMLVAINVEDQKRVSKILEPFGTKASISWGVHPVALPLQFGIITTYGSSKKEGAEAIVKSLRISFDEVLGIGDSTSDWKFIEKCGYAATLANGTKELKNLIKTKGQGMYYISKGSVDKNGILEILKYFFKLPLESFSQV